MKVSHECPLDMLEFVDKYNDYSYCLPHLLDEHPSYKDFFLQKKKEGKFIMMDNSVHELGIAYNHSRLKFWVKEIKPDVFIVPDVWEEKNETLSQAKYWMNWFKDAGEDMKNIELMAVVQAKSLDEAKSCYIVLKGLGYKRIAFSYGANYYKNIVTHPDENYAKALGRISVVMTLLRCGIIEEEDKLHLLGCALPQEFMWYKGVKQIETIDTSNPVMAALEGEQYKEWGLWYKPFKNINSCFDKKTKTQVYKTAHFNLTKFKILNGIS